MFTRYKGISIPENYSGSRFKAAPETETKLHKPSTPIYSGTKTSISPTFEEAIRQSSAVQYEPEVEELDSENDTSNDTNLFIESSEIEEASLKALEADEASKLTDTYKESTTNQESTSGDGVLGEFSKLFGKLSSGLKSENLLILAVILLIFSENNFDDNALILPLLALLLYN